VPVSWPGAAGCGARLSDAFGKQQYRRLGLFNEAFKPLGIEHQLGTNFNIHNGIADCISFCRTGQDFTERERNLFDLLIPHFIQSMNNHKAFANNRKELETLENLTEGEAVGSFSVAADGRLKFRNEKAQNQLSEKLFFGMDGKSRLPESAMKWFHGTARAFRGDAQPETGVAPFCAEMDGIESLQDIVIILATNRPDLIDPAILRPGRIDRKIKVNRPNKEASKDIFRIYLTPDLPIHPDILKVHDDDAGAAVSHLIDQGCEELFMRNEDNKFLEVVLQSGRRDILYRGDLCSGAIIASIVQRAKESAIKRAIADKAGEVGITLEDVLDAASAEYRENDIFPPTDSVEDWLKLLDYDPEHVVKVSSIRPEKSSRRKTVSSVI